MHTMTRPRLETIEDVQSVRPDLWTTFDRVDPFVYDGRYVVASREDASNRRAYWIVDASTDAAPLGPYRTLPTARNHIATLLRRGRQP